MIYKRSGIISRYGKKTIVDGITFDSESEAEFYKLLKKAKKNGDIKDFVIEPEYTILEEYNDFRGKKVKATKSYPDYGITLNDGKFILCDTKGGIHENLSILKRKILMEQHPEIPYYFISYTINALDNRWVETSPSYSLEKKLRLCYKKQFPNIRKLTGTSPRFTIKLWEKWMKVNCIAGLFFTFEKVYTKKELKAMNKK